jgi:hypothetical protein
MTNTYTINSTTVPNGGTVTLNTGAGLNGTYLTTGTSATTYTTGISTSYQWANSASEVMKINQTDPPTLEVKGQMVINGRDLEERLSTIEKVLQIPEKDVILESKHPKLKQMYDDYIKALAKYRTWEAIKGNDND